MTGVLRGGEKVMLIKLYLQEAVQRAFLVAVVYIKATKETCYTKKSGVFLPQPEPVWIPEFKTSSKDRTGFFEFSPSCFQDPVRLNQYIKKIWAELF